MHKRHNSLAQNVDNANEVQQYWNQARIVLPQIDEKKVITKTIFQIQRLFNRVNAPTQKFAAKNPDENNQKQSLENYLQPSQQKLK